MGEILEEQYEKENLNFVERNSFLSMIIAQFIFGTAGVITKSAALPATFVTMCRGAMGFVFLLILYKLMGIKIDLKAIRQNLLLLVITGASLAMHWILMYESYAYTTVATTSLVFYTAPIFVIVASPFVLGEKMTLKKFACVATALIGLSLVSGFWQAGFSGGRELIGVGLALLAALLYTCEVFLCKKLKDISSYDVTIVNMIMIFIVSAANAFFRVDMGDINFTVKSIVLLAVLCSINTAVAYVLYFGAFKVMPSQRVAILTYISPVVSVLLSALILREPLDAFDIVGGILILGACFVSER